MSTVEGYDLHVYSDELELNDWWRFRHMSASGGHNKR